MAPRTMPMRQAVAAVEAMPELSGARTPVSRAAAAKRTRAAERGQLHIKVGLDAGVRDQLQWLRQRLGVSTTEIVRLAVEALQRDVNLRDQMSEPGTNDLEWLTRVSGAHGADVVDLCVRYAAAGLRRDGVISVI